MQLVWPAREHLPDYRRALERGWSPDNLRPEAAQEELAHIAEDADQFLDEQVDREAKGPAIVLPDGRMVQRLPGLHKWMWDGEFCGTIGFRWQPGTPAPARRACATASTSSCRLAPVHPEDERLRDALTHEPSADLGRHEAPLRQHRGNRPREILLH